MVAVAGGADLRGDLLETGVSSAILRGLISTHQMAVRQPQRVSCVLTDTRGARPANGHGAPHEARALGQRRVRAAGGLPRGPSSGSSFGCRKHLDGGPLNRLLSGSASGRSRGTRRGRKSVSLDGVVPVDRWSGSSASLPPSRRDHLSDQRLEVAAGARLCPLGTVLPPRGREVTAVAERAAGVQAPADAFVDRSSVISRGRSNDWLTGAGSCGVRLGLSLNE